MFEYLRNKVKTLSDMAYAQYNHYQAKNKLIKWSPDGQYIGQVSTDTPEFKYILPGEYHSPNKRSKIIINKDKPIELWEDLYYKELYPDGNTKLFRVYYDNKKTIRREKYWDRDGNEKDSWYYHNDKCMEEISKL
jgi:hypothetical protein